VIVVDDGSRDGTSEALAERYPEAEVIVLAENHGFSRAVNTGIGAGRAEAVVLLNNDVRPEPRFLERIVAPLANDPHVGMVAALLLQADGGVIDSLGLEVDGTLAPFPRQWGQPAEGALSGTVDLLGPTGGAAAYRRTALAQVGGLDERIFAYGEDVDLALRLREAGWRCAVAPDAVGLHLGSASFGRNSPSQVYHRGWSRAYLLRKYGLLAKPGSWPRAILGEAASVIWQLARYRDPSGLRGRLSGWRTAHGGHSIPEGAVNSRLGLAETLRRRKAYRDA
jgi:N-acetylglucosaminyl-diphospho-decaprenol L-rhamnosyltransferase